MGKYTKLLRRILAGKSDANIPFSDFRQLLIGLGFDERIRGNYHDIHEKRCRRNSQLAAERLKGEAYQVKQVRNVIVRYKLGPEDAE